MKAVQAITLGSFVAASLGALIGPTILLAQAPVKLVSTLNRMNVESGQGGAGEAGTQSRLPETIKKLDTASLNFKSVSADFHKDLYTKLVNDTEKQEGSLYVVGRGNALLAGLHISGSHARTLVYKNGVAKDDTPGRCFNTVMGKQGAVEGALTLGFGGSGTDLAKHWEIKDDGAEKVNGVETEKLELTPKDQAVKDTYTRIDLWVDLGTGIAQQQKSYSPSGDTQSAFYSNIKLNKSVDMKPFEIKDQDCSVQNKKR